MKYNRRPKDDYKPNERRPYDRHSGTGRQAFGKNVKKQGHGKFNTGSTNYKDYQGRPIQDDEEEYEEEYIEQKTGLKVKRKRRRKKKKQPPLVFDEENFPKLEA